MSLEEKWEEYVAKHKLHELHIIELRDRQNLFYAGAEADCHEESMSVPLKDRLAEIDHFKNLARRDPERA